MNWLQDIKVMIFDLDGTLYQDYTFLGRYMKYLLQDVQHDDDIQQHIKEAYSILEGKHFVKFGYFYNRENQKVYGHEQFLPTSGFSWDGKKTDKEEKSGEDFFYIGDPWSIALVYADRFNVTEEKRIQSFQLVRKEMLAEQHEIERHHSLFDTIEKIEVDKKILMTNTPNPSGQEFVTHLKIEHLFHQYYYGAEKPFGMKNVVQALMAEGVQPHEILSVGDNPFNDLQPVKAAGGKTCLISQYEHEGPNVWDKSVKNLEELTDFLKKLQAVRI